MEPTFYPRRFRVHIPALSRLVKEGDGMKITMNTLGAVAAADGVNSLLGHKEGLLPGAAKCGHPITISKASRDRESRWRTGNENP
jgi:hypothetical protein